MKYFLLLLVLTVSCSELQVVGRGTRNVSFGTRPEEWKGKSVSAQETKHFYFFGLYPSHQEIDVDEVATSAGVKRFVIERIEDGRTRSNTLWSIFTFGLYTPRTIKFTGYGLSQ